MLNAVLECTVGQGQVGHTGSAQSLGQSAQENERSSAKTSLGNFYFQDPEIYVPLSLSQWA